MLELLGNDLTAQGRQSPADILTVKSPISPPRCRLFTSAMAPSTRLAAEYQLTAPVRAALQARLLEE